jgi:aquaporin Z
MDEIESKEGNKPLFNSKKLILEFMGTFSLTYVGSWAVIFTDLNALTRNGVALAHAIILTAFIWIGADISGAHYNPALTLTLVVLGRMEWVESLFYILSQLLGALVAAGFILIQISDEILDAIKDKSVLGIPTPGSSTYEISGIWGEVFGTFFLCYIFMATCVDPNKNKVQGVGAVAVGFMVYIGAMTIGELSGGGFNPARALGPAIVAGVIGGNQLTHVIGPIIGAILGGIIYSSVFIDDEIDLAEIEREKQLMPVHREDAESVELQ